MSAYTQNRELSWLKFNERVLDEAANENIPLLERLKFIEIFTSNLDEFFMVRVGSLYNLNDIDPNQIDSKSDLTPKEQIASILMLVKNLIKKKKRIYANLINECNNNGINIKKFIELDDEEKKETKEYLKNEILPFLSPSIIDSSHPFPLLENKISYVIAELKKKDLSYIGILEIPLKLNTYYKTSKGNIIFFEDFIIEFTDLIFKHFKVVSKNIICVTRNADIALDEMTNEEEIDLKHAMMTLIKKRNKLKPVRLEAKYPLTKDLSIYLLKKLDLTEKSISICDSPMQMKMIYDMFSLYPSKYFYPKFMKKENEYINCNNKIIPQILNKDALLFYPFESMDLFLKLIKEAALDKNTISISITIYRLSNKSKLVDYLIMAAENGISVTCLVELRARFDEKNNIDFAQRLEDSGCKVIFGFEQFKVHSKICLIKRKNKSSFSYITQIGTGNYNEKTVNLYTDYSYITANNNIGEDAALFFQNMLLGNLEDSYKYLLVSPNGLKNKIISMIEEEANKGENGYIFLKMNSITDIDIINHLQLASSKGCKIKMIVRGICCIIPNVLGYTENIEIHSIVGRFLEHSRIYQFSNGEDAKIYISSADFMTRNTTRRVEVAVPILDKQIKNNILNQIDIMLKDNINGRIMDSNGEYFSFENEPKIDSHQLFIDYSNNSKEIKPAKSLLKTDFVKKLKEYKIPYNIHFSCNVLGQKRSFDLYTKGYCIYFIEKNIELTSRQIEKWFFLSNQIKLEKNKLIIIFNFKKDTKIINQLNRIGVSCLFIDTIDDFINKLKD